MLISLYNAQHAAADLTGCIKIRGKLLPVWIRLKLLFRLIFTRFKQVYSKVTTFIRYEQRIEKDKPFTTRHL